MARITKFPWFIGARDETAFSVVTGEAAAEGYEVIEVKERHKYLGTTDDFPNFGVVGFEPLFKKLIVQKAIDDDDEEPEPLKLSVGQDRVPLYMEFRLVDPEVQTPEAVKKVVTLLDGIRTRVTSAIAGVPKATSYSAIESDIRNIFDAIPSSGSVLTILGFGGSTKTKSGVSADISGPGAEKVAEIIKDFRDKANVVVRQASDRESVSIIKASLTSLESALPSNTALTVLLTATDKNSNLGKPANFPGNKDIGDIKALASELAKQKKGSSDSWQPSSRRGQAKSWRHWRRPEAKARRQTWKTCRRLALNSFGWLKPGFKKQSNKERG